jgi:hypothetical protein
MDEKRDGSLRFHDEEPRAEGSWLAKIDAVDRVVTSAYEIVIYVAIAGMTGLAVFFYLAIADDASRDFLLLYGGVVYLIGMLWASSQLYSVRRRRAGGSGRSIRAALSQLGSKIEFKIETSEPQVFELDEAALDRAAQHMAAGGTIDEACARVAPQYAAMNGVMKAVFRKAVQAALEARAR